MSKVKPQTIAFIAKHLPNNLVSITIISKDAVVTHQTVAINEPFSIEGKRFIVTDNRQIKEALPDVNKEDK